MTRLIPWRDQQALDALRLGAVVLDRRGEVWQVLLVQNAAHGPTRGWFRLLAAGTAYGAGTVAEQGPLRVLYDRGTDLPENVDPCSYCGSTTNDPESPADTPVACPNCSGAGWFLTLDETTHVPIALAEAIDRTAILVRDGSQQTILAPVSLEVGMTVDAEPKAAHVGTAPRLRGRVVGVYDALDPQTARVDLSILDDGAMRLLSASARVYSFRPVEDL